MRACLLRYAVVSMLCSVSEVTGSRRVARLASISLVRCIAFSSCRSAELWERQPCRAISGRCRFRRTTPFDVSAMCSYSSSRLFSRCCVFACGRELVCARNRCFTQRELWLLSGASRGVPPTSSREFIASALGLRQSSPNYLHGGCSSQPRCPDLTASRFHRTP